MKRTQKIHKNLHPSLWGISWWGSSRLCGFIPEALKASRATLAQPQYSLLPEFSAWVDCNTKKWLANCSWVYVHTYTHTHAAPIFFLIKMVGVAARSSKTNVWGNDCETVWWPTWGEPLRKLTCAVSSLLWHTWGQKPHPNCRTIRRKKQEVNKMWVFSSLGIPWIRGVHLVQWL